MKNCMVDIETLGLTPGSVILSIGAVLFDETGIGDDFHIFIDIKDSVENGLAIDPDTLKWWLRQAANAQENSILPPYTSQLEGALMSFSRFFAGTMVEAGGSDWGYSRERCVWGNGADFDMVLLASAYAKFKQNPPWNYKSTRCYRTLKALRPAIIAEAEEGAIKHTALSDARHQARHAVSLLQSL